MNEVCAESKKTIKSPGKIRACLATFAQMIYHRKQKNVCFPFFAEFCTDERREADGTTK